MDATPDRPAESSAPTLNYSSDGGRRRRALKGLLAILVLIFGCGAFVRWGRPALHRLETMRAWKQCATFAMPTDRVVYEEHPDRVPALLWAKSEYVRLVPGAHAAHIRKYSGVTTWLAGPTPQGIAAQRVPWCLGRVTGRTFSTPSEEDVGLLYLSERTSRSGRKWIVAVHPEGAWDATTSMQFSFNVTSIPVSPSIAAGSSLQAITTRNLGVLSLGRDLLRPLGPDAPVRIFAGQSDPTDAARFTMEYEQKGRRGMIEGVVRDKTVRFTVLSGPAAFIEDPVKLAEEERRWDEFDLDR